MANSVLGKSRKANKTIKGIARQWLKEKREEAVKRQLAYAQLSVDEIISALNSGNYRATKQRKKLAARLASEEAAKVKAASPKVRKEKDEKQKNK